MELKVIAMPSNLKLRLLGRMRVWAEELWVEEEESRERSAG